MKTFISAFSVFSLLALCSHSTKESAYTLGKISITVNKNPFGAKVITRKNNRVVQVLRFDTIFALGGDAGLFMPKEQPLKHHFLVSKFGGYDGRLILIDTSGRIFNLPGGEFYVSNDRRYVFTNWERDGGNYGFTVFDAERNERIYHSGEIETEGELYSVEQWYRQGETFYGVAETIEKKLAVYFTPGVKGYRLQAPPQTKGEALKGYCRTGERN